MPNHNSNAGYRAERSCVVCKKKIDRDQLLKFFILRDKVVFDIANCLSCSKRYICHNQQCLEGLSKWRKKKRTKHR